MQTSTACPDPSSFGSRYCMANVRIAVALDRRALRCVDRLVSDGTYQNRSRAIEAAILESLGRFKRRRLARECSKLDARTEKSVAEAGCREDSRRESKACR